MMLQGCSVLNVAKVLRGVKANKVCFIWLQSVIRQLMGMWFICSYWMIRGHCYQSMLVRVIAVRKGTFLRTSLKLSVALSPQELSS